VRWAPELALRLAHPFAEAVGALAHEEGHVAPGLTTPHTWIRSGPQIIREGGRGLVGGWGLLLTLLQVLASTRASRVLPVPGGP
jgi:hypothetical protein